MINLTRHYASLFGPRKVRVNVISPGGIFNPDKPQPEPFLGRYNKMTMMNRMGEAREMSGAVVFLLSDASTYITGVNLPIDGGYTAK
jgi:NAD(P)-dependent dehydrogenase (short-subunit alcohol dehydrogenase family)